MTARMPMTTALTTVELVAENLTATRAFYEDLLGMRPDGSPDADAVLLRSVAIGHGHLALRLCRGPAAAAGTPADALSVTLDSSDELLDLYLLAQIMGYRAEDLRVRGGSLTARLYDPDNRPVDLNAPARTPATTPGRDIPGRERDSTPGRRDDTRRAAAGADRRGTSCGRWATAAAR